MAARKTKKKTRKTRSRRGGTLARLERELPSNLRAYSRQVRRQLNDLEKQIEKAGTQYRRRLARLIRDASHQLGRLEAHGESGWRKLAAPYRKDAQRLLKRLESAVKPGTTRKKKTSRKKTSSRKKTTRRKTTRKKASSSG